MSLYVKDIMTEKVVTIGPAASVQKAIERLLDADISSLAVVDENRRMIGLINESALLAATFDERIRNDPVSLHMDRNFVHVLPTDPIENVIDVSILHRVRNVPVVENGRLLGLVSRRSVMRTVFSDSHAVPY